MNLNCQKCTKAFPEPEIINNTAYFVCESCGYVFEINKIETFLASYREMKSDQEIIEVIDRAFGPEKRPNYFVDPSHCQECEEHNELLCSRTRESLSIEDVGNMCWTPLSMCTAEGFAYYMPSLARMSLAEPAYGYDWFGDNLEIHLSSGGENNGFLQYCSRKQKDAIIELVNHLNISRINLFSRLTESEDFYKLIDLWKT
jgi:DNA-directed RNA polymerase subunit M/transcription elongation factor TFIIS